MKKLTTILCGLLLMLTASGQTVFDTYFENAKTFAEAFPREKVHLHFDNNSYFQGDTIWFKAYVVDEDRLTFSNISKPLYVELVDQLGNIIEKQIVKLNKGQGEGQISLGSTFLTGYFEVRAYTKWMLAFNDETYFSRTFPIYRKPLSADENRRAIAEYRMDDSMHQRPEGKKKDELSVSFYPESGTLVKGIPTIIGIETLSRDSGWVNIEGILTDADGNEMQRIQTTHDGMGTFLYTPADKQASVNFMFNGRKHSFKLPKADNEGYNLRVNTKEESLDITITRSEQTPARQLALFIFSQGVPVSYVPVDLTSTTMKKVKVMTESLPRGTIRLSLINEQGNTLNDRFCFVYPKEFINLGAKADNEVYAPFAPIGCTVKVSDMEGQPLANANVSLAINDATSSDIIIGSNDIWTSLLLTSNLKGFINRPEFYFSERTTAKRRLLDNLMLIRGWRRYNIQEAFGVKEFMPHYLPESQLTLYGKAKSYFQGNGDLGITILAHNDSVNIAGTTTTDSIGRFSIPIDDFEGKMEALIQTRKEGKKINRAATVSFDRRFQPSMRPYDFAETNPSWDIIADTTKVKELVEEVLKTEEKTITLDEVIIQAKNRNKDQMHITEKFERSIIGVYNIRQIVDDMRDEGKIITNDIGNLMHEINPNINFDGTRYRTDSIIYSIDGHTIQQEYVDGFIDEIETAVLYTDQIGTKVYSINQNTFMAKENSAEDFWTGKREDSEETYKRDLPARLDFTMQERFNPNKSYVPTRGVRRTLIQGYNKPEEFYSPQYPDGAEDVFNDHRRTLFWAPTLTTDANGEITVNCYNSANPTHITISAETIVNGIPAAVNVNSIPQQ